MRVSTGMIYSQLTERMSDNSAEMAKMQGRLSLGLKYTRPSEAPDEVARVQALESRLKRLDTDVESISRAALESMRRRKPCRLRASSWIV